MANHKLLFVLWAPLMAASLIAAEPQSPAAIESGSPETLDISDYTISASDLLQVQVYQEEDLMREVRVSARGNINLPLVETVPVMGKTITEAEALLTELYNADYLVNPQINISVLEYSQRRVNVLGAVNQPGAVVFPPEETMNLVDAISRAGGFHPAANKRSVVLTRVGEDGNIETFIVNVQEIIQGNTEFSWPLESNDMIFVERSRI